MMPPRLFLFETREVLRFARFGSGELEKANAAPETGEGAFFTGSG